MGRLTKIWLQAMEEFQAIRVDSSAVGIRGTQGNGDTPRWYLECIGTSDSVLREYTHTHTGSVLLLTLLVPS
jgi:hypothetical protein